MQALVDADALVVMTEWKVFRSPDLQAIKAALGDGLVFDGRNLYEPSEMRRAGIAYFPVGRGGQQ